MDRIAVIRVAWAAAIAGVIAAFAYLTFVPDTGSFLFNNLLAGVLVLGGAALGGSLQVRIESATRGVTAREPAPAYEPAAAPLVRV